MSNQRIIILYKDKSYKLVKEKDLYKNFKEKDIKTLLIQLFIILLSLIKDYWHHISRLH